MTAPYNRPNMEVTVGDHHDRIRILEAVPQSFSGPAARFESSGLSLSPGGTCDAGNVVAWPTTVYDYIGITLTAANTILTTPASFYGANPIFGVHYYQRFYTPWPQAGTSEYSMWVEGPVNDVLGPIRHYKYDSSEYLKGGDQSDGFVLGNTAMTVIISVCGDPDIEVDFTSIDIVYLGQQQ